MRLVTKLIIMINNNIRRKDSKFYTSILWQFYWSIGIFLISKVRVVLRLYFIDNIVSIEFSPVAEIGVSNRRLLLRILLLSYT